MIVTRHVLPANPPTGSTTAGSDPVLATTELDSVGSTAPPVVGLSVLAAWAVCGLGIALLMHRRGHDGRALAGLGVALGPLLAPLALHLARTSETRETRVLARVLAPGRIGAGDVDVLVGFPDVVVDPGPLAEHLAVLGLDERHVRRVFLAAVIDHEVAQSWRWIELTADTARDLAAASDELRSPVNPGRVLVPGEPTRALRSYAEGEGYAVLVLVSTLQTEVLQLARNRG